MKVSAASAAAAAVLIALVAYAQGSDPCNTTTCYKSGTTKTPTSPTTATATTPTRLPVKTSTPAAKTTYAKDHAHTTVKSGPAANATTAATSSTSASANKAHGNVTATTAAANVTRGAVNATTTRPATLSEGHLALKQKLNTIAVRCKDELHAPQEIMALVSNTVVPQNEQQRCYLECVYKAINLIKNNKFSVADGKKLAQVRFAPQPEEHKKAVTIIETCGKEVVVDPKSTEKCTAGRLIRNCFVKNGEKNQLLSKSMSL